MTNRTKPPTPEYIVGHIGEPNEFVRFTPLPLALSVVVPTCDSEGATLPHRQLVDGLVDIVRGPNAFVVVRPAYVPLERGDAYVSVVEMHLMGDGVDAVVSALRRYLLDLTVAHDLGPLRVIVAGEAFVVGASNGVSS